MPYIIYADLESLIKNIYGSAHNPEKYLTTKIDEHIPWGYPISAIRAFDNNSLENMRQI